MIRVGRAVWACLRFERLAMEVFVDRDETRDLAVIEQQRVFVANREVLEPGTALATAFALCPSLQMLERQPQREADTLAQLAHWAYQITPDVVIDADNSLLLEIGSCQRLYGDLDALLRSLQTNLAERGHTITYAVAHTPKAAWLLAQVGAELALQANGQGLDVPQLERQLGAVGVTHLAVAAKVGARLQQMGLRTLAALDSLPLSGLGKRFGIDFVLYLQQLRGDHPDPQPPFVPQPVFTYSLAFIDGIHQRQTLVFPMKRLILALCDYLMARQFHCRVLTWRFYDAHVLQGEMTIELSRAQNRWRTFLELSQLKLDTLPLIAPVYTLTLHSDSFLEAAPGALTLFADPACSEDGQALQDRLSSRLGADALQWLGSAPSLWPEAASRLLPAAPAGAVVASTAGARPLWLLPEPSPIREHQQGLAWQLPLQLLRGPERIEAPFGVAVMDNLALESCAIESPVQRDYYIARESDGRLCWIFRELRSGRWFVHGLFA